MTRGKGYPPSSVTPYPRQSVGGVRADPPPVGGFAPYPSAAGSVGEVDFENSPYPPSAEETERDAILAGPLDPRVEYIPWRLATHRPCACPAVEAWFGEDRITEAGLIVPARHQLKVLHRKGCTDRVPVAAAPARRERREYDRLSAWLSAWLTRLPTPVPCPECGDVRFSGGPEPGQRKCWSCDHVWRPA